MTTASITTRTAEATWKGGVKGGHGLLSTESRALAETRFSLGCRLNGEDRSETNPEELLAAAASCFSMALSKTLTDRETLATQLVVTGRVDMTQDDDGIALSKLTLECEGTVPAADEAAFIDAVQTTQQTCPVLKTLAPGFDKTEVTAKFRS